MFSVVFLFSFYLAVGHSMTHAVNNQLMDICLSKESFQMLELFLGLLDCPHIILVSLHDQDLGLCLWESWLVLFGFLHHISCNADDSPQLKASESSQIQRNLSTLRESKQHDVFTWELAVIDTMLHKFDQLWPDDLLDLCNPFLVLRAEN